MSRLVSYFSLTLLFTLCAWFVDYAFVIVVIKESYYYYYYYYNCASPVQTANGFQSLTPATRHQLASNQDFGLYVLSVWPWPTTLAMRQFHCRNIVIRLNGPSLITSHTCVYPVVTTQRSNNKLYNEHIHSFSHSCIVRTAPRSRSTGINRRQKSHK